MAVAGVMVTCRLIVGRHDPMAVAGVMVTCRLIVGRHDPMAVAGVMVTCRLIVGRRHAIAPTAATRNLLDEWARSRVPSRIPAQKPAATSPVTSTRLTGPVCRRAGTTVEARP
jgi:hypothetical protein